MTLKFFHTFLTSSRLQAEDVLSDTPYAGRRGLTAFLTGVFCLGRLTPLLICSLIILSSPAIAQAGPFFGATNDTFGNIVKNVAEYLRKMLFVVGFIGLAIGAIQRQFMPQFPFQKTLMGAAICFGLSAVCQIIYGFSNNEQPTFDPTLTGN